MMVEMLSNELSGWLHVHVFQKVEYLWENPVAFLCQKIFCADKFTRRITKTEARKVDSATLAGEKIFTENKKKLKNRAARFEYASLVTIAVGLELFQQVLDIPYFGRMHFFLDDCDGLQESRRLTKPVYYYVLYICIEVYGTLLYMLYVKKFLVVVTDLGEYTHSYEMSHILFSMVEIPSLMILEFFFHERFTSSDGFLQNKMIMLNNSFTLAFLIKLAMVSFDYLMAQIRQPKHVSDFNSRKQDGILELDELVNVICSVSLMVAQIIRIYVNQWGDKQTFPLISTNPNYNSTNINSTNIECNEFQWEHVSHFVSTDWAYRKIETYRKQRIYKFR